MKPDLFKMIHEYEKRLIVVIGDYGGDTDFKEVILNCARESAYEIIYNPENNRHPKEQVEVTEDIIIDLNNRSCKMIVFTNSTYFVDHLANLMKAHILTSRGKRGISDMFLRKNVDAFISPSDVAVFDVSKDKINSILNYKTGMINWDTFSNVSDYVSNLYFNMED